MRTTLLTSVFALASFASVLAAPPSIGRAAGLGATKDALAVPRAVPVGEADDADTTDGGSAVDTTFDGKKVPPMMELTGTNIDEQIATGNWMVEFFSPYCHHCKAFAPTYQTLYEYYYTSDPVAASQDSTDSLNSFTRFYDFKFAKVDCVAFGSMCTDKDIKSYPSVVQYKDGQLVKKNVGTQKLSFMSDWVEEVLESVRPGSRSKDGVKLPKVGASRVDGTKSDVTKAKDKNAAAGVAAGLKANEILEAELSTATGTKSALKATPLPREKPNQGGKSIALTAENFQRLVTTTRDPWFVKFYAPWCHHCNDMAAGWQGMARDMQNELNVGEVNCEAEKRLCKDVHIEGFPSLLYFQGGERIEYDGLRGLGDLISFANKAVVAGDGVVDVSDADFKAMEKDEEVIFLYLYDHATTSEDFQALERLMLSLIGHAKLVKTNDPLLYRRFKVSTWPRLLVSRDGKPSYYNALAPKDMRDFRRVLGWMQSVWLPIVPELTASNAQEIMDHKLVVLGILSRERSDEFIIAKREIKNAALEWIDKQTQAYQLERQELRDAKQLRIEEAEDRNDQRGLRAAKSIRINPEDIERKEVGFAWVDGVFWERWIKTTFGINVKDGERVVINDEDNRRYWDNTVTGNPIVPSRTSILETLPKVVSSPPKLSPKSTGSSISHFFFKVRSGLTGHPLISIGIALGLLIGAVVWGRGQIRKGRAFGSNTGGFFQLDGKEAGLLGGNGGGSKAD